MSTGHVHLVLQGKGGVGKSLAAAVLAQYLTSQGRTALCIDTDPVNATLSGYRALDVQRVQILHDDEIDPRAFDQVIETIATQTGDCIIDNGASSFVPLTHYLISHDVPALLRQLDRTLHIHTIITGGQALLDTVSGFAQLASQFPEPASFVVWLNPLWGPVQHDGKDFDAIKAFIANRARVSAIVRLPDLKPETYGRDFADMWKAHQTFADAMARPDLPIMVRQRLTLIQRQIWAQLDAAHLF